MRVCSRRGVDNFQVGEPVKSPFPPPRCVLRMHSGMQMLMARAAAP